MQITLQQSWYLFKVTEKIYGLFEQKNSQDCQQTMQTVTLRVF